MDKISSYPIRFLEAFTGPNQIGPERPVIGQAHHIGAIHSSGPAKWPKNLQSWTFSKLLRFPKIKLRRFFKKKNEIAPFFQNTVISKITFLIN